MMQATTMTETAKKMNAPRKEPAALLLGHDLDWWNGATVFALFLAAAAAVAIVLTQAATIRLQKIKADQDAVTIATLQSEASAAQLEQERLKAQLAWRVMDSNTATALEQSLSAHPGSVNIKYTASDPESLYLAIQFSKIFATAKWKTTYSSVTFANAIFFGIALPDSSGPDAQSLRDAFAAANISFSTNTPPPVSMAFTQPAISGAPTLWIGSKQPPVL